MRSDFPNLDVKVNGNDLVYFDNAATTFKPIRVIDSINNYNTRETSNVHRGLHQLSQIVSEKYENSRDSVKNFINAKSNKEVIFTKGTTESINLVSYSYNLEKGDIVLVSEMEHHSNIVPWQLLEDRKGIIIKKIPINDSGEIDMEKYRELLKEAKLVCIVHVSNSLGTINPVKEIISIAHLAGAKVLVDAAQSIAHMKIDVQDLDVDFLAFSGHKMYGPTGVGVLYGKEDLLEDLKPFQGGGGMIEKVSFNGTSFAELPLKFEAGTPNISGVIGLGEAVRYIKKIGLKKIKKKESELLDYATSKLKKVDGLKIIGEAKEKASIISFIMDKIHSHDVSTYLNEKGIAIRAGHHCCQPVMDKFNISSTSRVSMCFYNSKEEIKKLVSELNNINKVFL